MGNLLGKVVSNAVESAVDGVMKSLNPSEKDAEGMTDAAAEHSAEDGYCRGESELRERIEAVVAEEWQGYKLRRNVPSSELAAKPRARQFYTYGIYRNDVPVAMIMFLDNNSAYRRKEVRLAQEACRERGIPYQSGGI